MMRNTATPLALCGALLAGCAAHCATDSVADPDGFWSELCHGIVFPVALLADLVSWFAATHSYKKESERAWNAVKRGSNVCRR